MSGHRDLAHLMRVMQPVMDAREFVFATVASVPPGVTPLGTFVEAEGITLILDRAEAVATGVAYTYPCRLITLTVHSSLEAVGFLSAITAVLTTVGISTNVVSAYYHDHLLVPTDRADEAMAVLAALSTR
jgi:hypothetical protein